MCLYTLAGGGELVARVAQGRHKVRRCRFIDFVLETLKESFRLSSPHPSSLGRLWRFAAYPLTNYPPRRRDKSALIRSAIISVHSTKKPKTDFSPTVEELTMALRGFNARCERLHDRYLCGSAGGSSRTTTNPLSTYSRLTLLLKGLCSSASSEKRVRERERVRRKRRDYRVVWFWYIDPWRVWVALLTNPIQWIGCQGIFASIVIC